MEELGQLYTDKIPMPVFDEILGQDGEEEEEEERRNWEDETFPDWPIPEAFLWHYILSVSEAIVYLQTGYEPEGGYPDDWDPIMHRDHGTTNVFLHYGSDDGDDNGQGFPRIILGDFGLSSRESDPVWGQGAIGQALGTQKVRALWEDIEGIGTCH